MIEQNLIKKCEESLNEQFKILEDVALSNQEKVLNAFKKNNVALRHFVGSTGYGYGDEGKEVLNKLFADVFGAEASICSPNIVSGTHAISVALFGVLRPGDKVLSVTGEPYDTLSDVLYANEGGSLKEYGIEFNNLPLKNDKIDFESIKKYFENNEFPKMLYLQRSRGYSWRRALSVLEIKEFVDFVRGVGCNS